MIARLANLLKSASPVYVRTLLSRIESYQATKAQPATPEHDAGESAPGAATPARAFWRKMTDARTEDDYEEKIAKARSNGTADELSVDVTIYGLQGDFDISIGGPHGTFESFCDFLEGAVDAYCRGEALEAERDDAVVLEAIDTFLTRFAGTGSAELRSLMRAALTDMFQTVEIPKRAAVHAELLRGIVDGLADAELSFVQAIAGSVAAHGDDEPAVKAG